MKYDPHIAELHRFCDLQMRVLSRKTTVDGRPPTCGANCSACCYEPVYCSTAELHHALGRLTPQQRKDVKSRTETWLGKVVPSGLLDDNLPNVFSWRALRAPCPFLENHRCMIYEDRPMSCRLHLAIGPREKCFSEEGRRTQIFAHSPDVIARCSVVLVQRHGKIDMDNLGVTLADILLHQKIPSASHRIHTRAELAAVTEKREAAAQLLP